MDKIDLKILSALQRDGRMTKQRLSEEVALSPSACLARMQKLEKDGIIKSYGTEVALGKIGPHSIVIVEITLKKHKAEDFEKFEKAIANIPEIVECLAVGGGIDYIARFVTRSIEEYQNLMDRLLEDDLGIDRYFSFFVTKPIKKSPPDLFMLAGKPQ
ncbi:MAG: Lrp/AsnC family transcriptional regulator [Micavibrio sp.]|nr:MAG: Lrp/AsnC family transcriptional regulator [Micavibrio sp.]